MRGVSKALPLLHAANDVSLELEPGQILGSSAPTAPARAPRSGWLMGLLAADAGEIRVLGHAMPEAQAARQARHRLRQRRHAPASRTPQLGWHMKLRRVDLPGWDAAYAATLLQRFNLRREQPVRSLSHRRARQGAPAAGAGAPPAPAGARRAHRRAWIRWRATSCWPSSWTCCATSDRSILFSSHNTLDVERISDRITFIDRGRVVAASDKETFLDALARIVVQLRRRGASSRRRAAPGIVALRGATAASPR
jgi:ABC-2 type transport system ATP-binding protein